MPGLTVTAMVDVAGSMAEAVAGVMLIGGTMLLIFGMAAVLSAWLVVRKVQRSRRIRNGWTKSTLTVRSLSGDDAGRRLARLRIQLRRSAEATERTLAAADIHGRPVGDLPAVAANLARAERTLDEQLRLAEREPHPALKQTLAARLDEQVRRACALAAELRQNLLLAGDSISAAQLERASRHLALEADALRAWNRSYGGRTAAPIRPMTDPRGYR
ncbi:hypothetical protein LVY72_08760 [Arthrobacter sp. I2-34]|uniref:Uncharacterized protein n=1 Tax=Arthrobacter hankyongi TaxID=2904801 RepID=A0ABS9L5Q4_9MICC|nr:hypothetical protein [Arthrobacter hankyongi]MCG2622007.1 hypothetical protein [Arthrobacter hankyongi]